MKDPAFLFYPGDWNLGTMHLTLLEKGCYMELLILQFAKGKFTEAHAKHMLNGSFDYAWAMLKDKFETDGIFYWNKRLELEKDKRKNYTESRRSNASKPKNIKKTKEAYAKDMPEHMHKHMEDENENINTIEYNQEKIENMIVKQMLDVWMKNNKKYQYEEITDYPALLNLAYKIAKTKNWSKDDVIKTRLPECLASWEKIVVFIKQHDFYKQLAIKNIEKQWAGLYQTMNAFKECSKKVDVKDPTKIKISL